MYIIVILRSTNAFNTHHSFMDSRKKEDRWIQTWSIVSTRFLGLDPDFTNYIPLFQYHRSMTRSPFLISFFRTLHSIFQKQDAQSTNRHKPDLEWCILKLKVPKLHFLSSCCRTGLSRCIASAVIVVTRSYRRQLGLGMGTDECHGRHEQCRRTQEACRASQLVVARLVAVHRLRWRETLSRGGVVLLVFRRLGGAWRPDQWSIEERQR